MTHKHLLTLIGITSAAIGCATGGVTFEGEGGAGGVTSSTSTSGQGGGGTGGAEGGQGGTAYPCGMDCSQITTDQCFQPICNEEIGQCAVIHAPAGTPCDDGLFCTVNESCNEGICGGGATNSCGLAPPACTAIVCHETAQSCSTTPSAEGTLCIPTDPCLVNATCQNGLCVGNPKDCLFAPVPNECYVAVCNPANGSCEPIPGNDGDTCHDENDPCLINGTCGGGTCNNTVPLDCSYLTVGCQDGVCNQTTGQCEAQPIPPGSTCAAATDDCNLGVCSTSGQCIGSPVNEGGPCDDGLSCTSGTTCTGGVCGGGTSTITIYFSEDFSSNSAGWTLGPEWAIGPTSVGPSVSYGNPDPATDHSSTADNGVAGVVLGGNAATASTHDFYYLESPPVDVAAAPVVYLEFWRWLNSDYTPFMENRVEVFNGSGWVVLWASGSSPGVQDAAWTPVSFDLTPHKNAQLRVRFGFNIGSTGVYTVSSWNVDDVVIASGICNP